ncbi:rifin PIR protein, putative [Plasmodium reichenowi]|uniref:Rifin PIR protein, putative n=1 Tax=Plasmodium reichenowi TaxID=5854 RepID=A0A2P9DHI9_PLARE|nr:rifin PIR protein, putative [Plasmodium reichenowi]
MKLHYSNILLFFLPLNILLTSYHVHNNKNKLYITPHHTATTTSRMLIECDIQSSIYDKDAEMKNVMQQFDDRTSQRFEEHEEHMKDKRQKRKEERDKNIQEIVKKDKMEKSLAEKIEKVCLKCGCGLGGVAASVALFGGLGTYGWKTAATTAAIKAAGDAAGDAAGVQALINGLEQAFNIEQLNGLPLARFITKDNYFCESLISGAVKDFYLSLTETELTYPKYLQFHTYRNMQGDRGTQIVVENAKNVVQEAVQKASKVTTEFTATEMASLESGEITNITATSTYSYSAIGYSILAILIIVLFLIIIYLVLRYRRKKKMNKKAQYTKLLNQ